MPKLLRHVSHRTNQVRHLVFQRDAIYNKEVMTTKASSTAGRGGGTTSMTGPSVSFGYESSTNTTIDGTTANTAYHVTSPELLFPGVQALQSPITSRSGNLERSGHRISGECTLYLPNLDYIRALDNFAESHQFDEFESHDKFIDMERIIINPSDITDTGQQTIDLSPGSTYPAGYELDRVQFKIKTDTSSGGDLVYVKLVGIDSTEKHITWTATDTFTPTDWVTVDLPLRDITTGDTQEVYIGGEGKTLTATSNLDIDKLKGGVSTSYLSSLIIDISGSASVELKELYLYKSAEWSIESIKDYRDEYMQIEALRVRGDRTSRRRAYG